MCDKEILQLFEVNIGGLFSFVSSLSFVHREITTYMTLKHYVISSMKKRSIIECVLNKPEA
jgi:hypothetical protein